MSDHTVPCADAAPIVTDEIRDEINGAEFWQMRAWVEDLLPEVDRLRAMVTFTTLPADIEAAMDGMADEADRLRAENALLRGDNATLGSTVTELRDQLREALGEPT